MSFQRMRLYILLPLVCFLLPVPAHAEIPTYIRKFLIQTVGAKLQDFERIEAGQAFVNEIGTKKKEEIALIGVIKIKASPEFYISKYRDIVAFESGSNVSQSGIFRSPARPSDVSGLTWEPDDLQKLSQCKRNDCGFRLPVGTVLDVRSQIDWSSGNAYHQANGVLRQKLVELVNNYRQKGDGVLPVYVHSKPIRVRDGLTTLFNNSRFLKRRFPSIVSYLMNYPSEEHPNAEDFFYWQKGGFGLQPVIRVSHVTIFKLDDKEDFDYVVSSKMLFANHYFRDGLQWRLLLPDSCQDCGFYLIAADRSHVDGMTGLRGFFVRGTTIKKSLIALEKWLTKTKTQIEQEFRTR